MPESQVPTLRCNGSGNIKLTWKIGLKDTYLITGTRIIE
jgi:hypothetical protein